MGALLRLLLSAYDAGGCLGGGAPGELEGAGRKHARELSHSDGTPADLSLPPRQGIRHPTHTLADGFTSYEEHDRHPARSLRYAGRFLRQSPRYSYIHHHTFPSLTTASSTFASYVQAIYPTSPTTSRSLVRLFFAYGDDRRQRQRLFGKFYILPKVMRLARSVFAEDSGLFADIQKGIEASRAPGVIGTREERIWAFQKYVLNGCGVGG